MLNEHTYDGKRLTEVNSASGGRLAWMKFDSLRDVYTSATKLAEKLAAKGKDWAAKGTFILRTNPIVHRDTTFRGVTKLEEFTDYETLTSFLYKEELKTEMANMEGVIKNASGKLNAPTKLVVGARPIGIFSMSHASRGLFRIPEYFNPITEKVVDKNKVDRVGEEFVFNTTENGRRVTYKVEQRQEGTTEMLVLNKNAVRKYAGKMLYCTPVSFEGHTLKFGTSVKKVYLQKSTNDLEGEGSDRFIDLFVVPSVSSDIKKEMMLYTVLPALLVVKAFEGSGFKIALHKLAGSSAGNDTIALISTLTNYGEPIDYDAIARGGGDPRMLRVHDFGSWSTFFYNHYKYDMGSGMGRPLQPTQTDALVKEYAFYAAKQAEQGRHGFKNANPTLYIPCQTEQGNNAAQQRQRAIDKFLEIMDVVGVQFQSATDFANEAIDRYEKILKMDRTEARDRARYSIRHFLNFEQPHNTELRLPESKFDKLADRIKKAKKAGLEALKFEK